MTCVVRTQSAQQNNRTVMIAGEVLVADEATLREEGQTQAEKVARRVVADPVHREMALLEAVTRGLP